MTSTPVRLDRAQIEAAARRHMHCGAECDVPALLLHAAALEAELAAHDQCVAQMAENVETLSHDLEAAQAELAAAQEHIVRLQDAVERYGAHYPDCLTDRGKSGKPYCSCGWKETRAALEGAAPDEHPAT